MFYFPNNAFELVFYFTNNIEFVFQSTLKQIWLEIISATGMG